MALSSLVCIDDVERVARAKLPRPTVDYYWSGADEENTLARNVDAFKEFVIRPRMLRDVSRMSTEVTVLGDQRFSMPIGIAPTAFHRLAHPDGEQATARGTWGDIMEERDKSRTVKRQLAAAAQADTVMICSTIATTSIEEIAKVAKGTLWFQLYVYKDRTATLEMVRRAEQCGCKALVVTVDTPVLGRRRADARNGFTLPPPLTFANFVDSKSQMPITKAGTSGFAQYVNDMFDRSLSWKDIKWLTQVTRLPVVVKGILTGEDALLAAEHGARAVLVSNHGGRQLDSVPATVVAAVGKTLEVYMDGGVRTGGDVLKALGLGARMVFVGRPIVWGLAVAGAAGVAHVLDNILRPELLDAMALAGCATVERVRDSSGLIAHRSNARFVSLSPRSSKI